MKKIIFDFDGTLVNSNEAVIASLNATYFEFRGEMPDYTEDIEPILGKPLEVQIESFKLKDALFNFTNNHIDLKELYDNDLRYKLSWSTWNLKSGN